MPHWLYEQIISENPSQQPQLALQSTVNWARSLALEIGHEHGESAANQYQSCRKLFQANTKRCSSQISNHAIFEPLFSTLTNVLTIISSASLGPPSRRPWTIPSLIVDWYYAFTPLCALCLQHAVCHLLTHTRPSASRLVLTSGPGCLILLIWKPPGFAMIDSQLPFPNIPLP